MWVLGSVEVGMKTNSRGSQGGSKKDVSTASIRSTNVVEGKNDPRDKRSKEPKNSWGNKNGSQTPQKSKAGKKPWAFCVLCHEGHSVFAPDCPNTHGVISKEVVDMLKIANFCMTCTNPNCKEQSICKGESPFLCPECGVNKRVCTHTTAKN